MNKKKIIIFGTGEYADLATYYFNNDEKCDYEVVAYTSDPKYITSKNHNNLPVVSSDVVEQIYPPSNYDAHVALSYRKLNQIREEKYHLMKEKGYKLVSYVCSKSVTWPDLDVGDNCFILENQTIQPTVKIGNNVMIWSGNHLGHNCSIGDHTYISSHVCISGHVEIGERCFLGVNSAFADFIKVGSDCFIGMGADVVTNLEDGSMALCSKGNIFDKHDSLTKRVMKSYFRLEE